MFSGDSYCKWNLEEDTFLSGPKQGFNQAIKQGFNGYPFEESREEMASRLTVKATQVQDKAEVTRGPDYEPVPQVQPQLWSDVSNLYAGTRQQAIDFYQAEVERQMRQSQEHVREATASLHKQRAEQKQALIEQGDKLKEEYPLDPKRLGQDVSQLADQARQYGDMLDEQARQYGDMLDEQYRVGCNTLQSQLEFCQVSLAKQLKDRTDVINMNAHMFQSE
jgi:hypothetical protein